MRTSFYQSNCILVKGVLATNSQIGFHLRVPSSEYIPIFTWEYKEFFRDSMVWGVWSSLRNSEGWPLLVELWITFITRWKYSLMTQLPKLHCSTLQRQFSSCVLLPILRVKIDIHLLDCKLCIDAQSRYHDARPIFLRYRAMQLVLDSYTNRELKHVDCMVRLMLLRYETYLFFSYTLG